MDWWWSIALVGMVVTAILAAWKPCACIPGADNPESNRVVFVTAHPDDESTLNSIGTTDIPTQMQTES